MPFSEVTRVDILAVLLYLIILVYLIEDSDSFCKSYTVYNLRSSQLEKATTSATSLLDKDIAINKNRKKRKPLSNRAVF